MDHFLLKNIRVEQRKWSDNIKNVEELTSSSNILVKDGMIEDFIDDINTLNEDVEIIDGHDGLVLPALRDMHCHIDKSKLGTKWTPVSQANSIVERFTNEPRELDQLELSLVDRASHLIGLELSHGVHHFRSHIDVHSAVGQRYLEQSLKAAERFKDVASFEFVAFPQHGLLRSNSVTEVDTALSNGASIIGGVDPASVDGDYKASLEQTFNLAIKHDVDIDLHIHDRGKEFVDTLKYLLHLTEQSSWENRVTLSHAFGLNDLEEETDELIEQIKHKGIQIISSVPISGNVPPLEQLRNNGITVNLGCDNIYDCWSPYGDGDIREKLKRYGEIFNVKTHNEIVQMLPLITGRSLNYNNTENASGLNKGDEATFVLSEASCVAEFIARPVNINDRFYQGRHIKFPQE